MREITKKQNKEFNDKFTELALEMGAKQKTVPELYPFYVFELDTRVGILEINLPKVQHTCYAVFSCFKLPALAVQQFSCNPHSGKYNTFLSKIETAKKTAEIAANFFKLTLPK
jgi:hypothetical protein